ncbi:glycosyltransferase [Paenibacillus sp. F411]|uniref:Glycosyl transferase family 2 n=1 Tax=Paenibacillus algicola TaxID=2565926 RepID=A0A4V1G3Y9_9BACL|nr:MULTISPECIES: glycosyltransferase [Paenibacillus]MBO2942945.1 glycosyltransferase [Paenibacillus sp. F411]QCT02854.1 glycosyl transferase family 2 [Paenibacillus algicola]
MTPKVTIVIPFYNCPYIEHALSSACGQTYPNVEVVVVDDGSSQHSHRITPFRDSIHYLGKKNGGTASALNHGILHASGEYIAWLSSDDLFHYSKLEQQMAFMQEYGLQVSYTDFSTIDSKHAITRPTCGIPMSGTADLARQLTYSNPVNGCTVVASKDLFMSLGLFNERLRYTHDYDMWVRMILHGARFGYLHEPLTLYRVHSGMGTVRHKKTILREYGKLKKMYRASLNQRWALGG